MWIRRVIDGERWLCLKGQSGTVYMVQKEESDAL